MSDVIVIPSAAVERLRRKAKKLKKETGVSHHEALDLVAREMHFPDWHHLIEAAKATEPSERAFNAGVVIGMDPKEANDVDPSGLIHFTPDQQVVMFVRSEFERQHPQPWSEDVGFDWQDFEELVFFRSKGTAPGTLEETLEVCQEDFFFPPRYVRLRGKVVVDMFTDEEDEDV